MAGGSRTRHDEAKKTGGKGKEEGGQGGADSDVVEVDSQGEWSETLEYDASQPLFTE